MVQDAREGLQGKGPRLLSCSKTKCTFIAIVVSNKIRVKCRCSYFGQGLRLGLGPVNRMVVDVSKRISSLFLCLFFGST